MDPLRSRDNRGGVMGMGGAVVLFAIGAILKFATNARVSGIDLQQVGVIIMVASAVWFVVMVAMYFSRRRTVVSRDRYEAPTVPAGPGDPRYDDPRYRRTYQERSEYDEPM